MNSLPPNPLAITIAGLLLLTAVPAHADSFSSGVHGFTNDSVNVGNVGFRIAGVWKPLVWHKLKCHH